MCFWQRWIADWKIQAWSFVWLHLYPQLRAWGGRGTVSGYTNTSIYEPSWIYKPLWIYRHPGASRDGLALPQDWAGSHGHVLWGQFTAWQQLLLSSFGLPGLSSAPAVAPQGLGQPGRRGSSLLPAKDITQVPCTKDKDQHAAHGCSQPFTPSWLYPADLKRLKVHEGIEMFKAKEKAQNKDPAIPSLFTLCQLHSNTSCGTQHNYCMKYNRLRSPDETNDLITARRRCGRTGRDCDTACSGRTVWVFSLGLQRVRLFFENSVCQHS